MHLPRICTHGLWLCRMSGCICIVVCCGVRGQWTRHCLAPTKLKLQVVSRQEPLKVIHGCHDGVRGDVHRAASCHGKHREGWCTHGNGRWPPRVECGVGGEMVASDAAFVVHGTVSKFCLLQLHLFGHVRNTQNHHNDWCAVSVCLGGDCHRCIGVGASPCWPKHEWQLHDCKPAVSACPPPPNESLRVKER